MKYRLHTQTLKAVRRVFDQLDYQKLGPVYCYEGGDEFWQAKRQPCQTMGLRLARALMARLKPGGRSLYVGAGVAELPVLLAEALELGRTVQPYNLRRSEVTVLNRACRGMPVMFHARTAAEASGKCDHLWMVSVLNDPERFPDLSPLSYGNVDPVTFNPRKFEQQRKIVRSIVDRCLPKLSLPGLVTTSSEEVVWIADWCHRKKIPYRVERRQYPTALVGDPICLIRVGKG
ncbi:MAG: hypothetical protein OEW25_01725 [Nitrospira sp.]|nr:hypothetical protein [Nitrospira sp.]MDH5252016.1 hypothetical protein [Nitrospira sp.]